MDEKVSLHELVTRWHQSQQEGQALSLEEVCGGSPEQLEELKQHLRAVASMQALLESSEDGCASVSPTSGPEPTHVMRPRGPIPPVGPAPLIPGYEILGELGRGGMGVVYKARHRQLNRLVALKMVLAGGYASQGERQRLRTEAEAIAHLQHAHIVQIYEVGECDGRPFLALEFCAGGSLDRKLAGVPLPPVEAAQLVQTLAQAVHAAHQHHVIHRDLKPANVLLTEDGTVKITDFGLAKRLDVEQALTQSGAIMGTPSYMAPEQAQGERGQVGPATDVYALGAILYEVLTGRPPFKAPSVVDTLAQVVQVEPVAPSRLQAKVPRDLETVCLKCLQKEPGRRYASAWDLAEDLRRFQAGEPILARPVGRLERGWRWCRRNPALAVLSAAIVLLLVGSLAGMTGLYLNAEDERRQAETERTLADAQRRRAEGERQRADDERDRAKKHADEAKSQKQVADEQRTVAHDEADRARQVSQFLAAMFGASDPLGLNTLMFNLNPRTGEELTASAILDLGYKRIAGDKQLSPRVRADILDTIGNVYRSRGQREEAEPLLNEALKLRRAAKAPPGELAASLHSLAWLHHERGNYPTAIKLYREALQLRETEAERDEVAIANHQFNLAWVLTEIEQYDEAEQLLRKVIARRLARFGPDHRETALAKAALAAVYLDAGRDAAALPLVQEAMTAFGKLSEDKNIQQAMTKFQQGVLWGRMFGDQAAAEKHLRDSLAFARKSLDAKHILVLYPLVQLGLTLEKRKKYDEAEELLREAVAIGRGRFGSGHPKSLSVVPPLARLLRKRGAGQEADALFEELVAGHKQRFGEADPFVADVLCEYADHLFGCREFSRQEEALQAAAKIYRAAEGPPRRRFAYCLRCLSAARFRAAKYAEGEPYYRELLAVERKRYPKAHPDVLTALFCLANDLTKQGKCTTEVDELLREAERLLGELTAADQRRWQHDVVMARCAFLQLKDPGQAEADALLQQYRLTMPADALRFQDLAYRYAECVALVAKASDLPIEERQRLSNDYGAKAVVMLRQALAHRITTPERWQNLGVLAPLKGRSDFEAILAEIRSKKGRP